MQRFASFFAVALIAVGSVTAADAPAVDPTLNGLPLGSSEADVLDVLGAADSFESYPPEVASGMGPTKSLHYNGLVVGLHREVGTTIFAMWRFEITGSQWRFGAAGVRIGQTTREVIEALGNPVSVEDTDVGEEWHLPVGFDGWTILEFHDGLLVRVFVTEDWS